MLADAGWRLDERARVTVELKAPPDGIADYVLWDESGLPLAVVEAKRAGIDPTVGFTQAQGYADALEAKHGRRPVLYCTNGIETWLMDDRSDQSPRRVYGFHERKSLERLVHRRGLAPLTTYAPKAGIADRIYQIEAVKRVLARFEEGSRRALIVQATGTGKTRVAVSLCETLMRAQRAQRILFLCDRRALRDQADQAFNELLPNEPRMVLGVEAAEGEGNKNSSVPKAGASVEKNLHEQRIYLATYPTMMRLRERYDVGFFDLIIADESHRSIYNKYRDLFLYFDALQVGLTATPVGYIDHNTYTLFNCGDQDPTFHYEYDAAVEDGHLVPYNPVAHDTHFLRQGVRWDEMTDAQRARIEASEDDPKAIDYDADQIDRQVMVTGTARAMFSVLMEKGLRDASQSRPGKTVIFARSHKHAMFLAGVFEKQFPEFPKDFCKVIDNHDPRADRLIARFKKLDDVLTLAISVDMLDTGIDVPEIVNLVFARPVRSLVKFLQMLGRGTRLCKNLYGPGKHKTEFVVIDHWHNFEHFSIRRAAREMALSTPLRERIFLARIDVVTAALQRNDTDSFHRALRLVVEDLNALLSSPSLSVRDQHGALAPLCDPERLQQWSTETRAGLRSVAAKLMRWIDVRDEELAALRFDLMIAELELSMLEESSLREAHQGRIARVLAKLPRNLGQVVAKASLLDAVASPGYWSASTTEGTERLRSELRELMALIDDKVAAEPVRVLDLEDHGAQTTAVAPLMLGEQELKPYRARVRQVLEQHFDENPTLRKIKRGEAVHEADLDELARLVLKVDPSVNLRYLPTRLNAQGGLHRVLRGIVGMDSEAIEAAFQGYVAQHPELTAQQLQFLQMVKQHIRVNGGIEINELYQAPFTAMSADGVEGVFRNDRQIDDLLRLLGAFSLEAS